MNASTTSDESASFARPAAEAAAPPKSARRLRHVRSAPAAAWTTPAKSKYRLDELEQRVDVEQVAVAVERVGAAEDPQVAEHVDQQEDEQEERAAVRVTLRVRTEHAAEQRERDARARAARAARAAELGSGRPPECWAPPPPPSSARSA